MCQPTQEDPQGQESQSEDGEHGEDLQPPRAPQTKSELSKLREHFSNTLALVAHLYHDLSLRYELIMVSSATKPFLNAYSESLEAHKQSQAG